MLVGEEVGDIAGYVEEVKKATGGEGEVIGLSADVSRAADCHDEKVRALLIDTKEKRHLAFELAEAITELGALLAREARGGPLESLYEKVPELLKGYVELHYDLGDHPSFRYFEQLLYRSRFNQTAAQRQKSGSTHVR